LERLRRWARSLKRDVVAVWFAARHPGTPLHVRLLAVAVTAYALSPIDLIPDFVPVLGYVDDLLIVPLGLLLVLKLLPAPVLQECRERADRVAARPTSRAAAAIIVAAWVACAAGVAWWILH